jgi:tRNA A-37 threonylcarbamoyl transferase component Bud32
MLSDGGVKPRERAGEDSQEQAIDVDHRSGFGDPAETVGYTSDARVMVTTSLAPPSPLTTALACETPIGTLDTLHCGTAGPGPLVSYPPPSTAISCGLGMVIDGRYKIDSVLGEGGMGIVYLARHCIIDKRVAIKVLRRDFAHNPEIAERFLFEAKAASSIGNPHIVDISDFGRLSDGATYFVMEWLDGSPLSKLVADGQRVPVARVISIGRQIAEALYAAHQQDIVHRDLKADNVFLVKRGNEPDFVKILDFGIAKVTSGEAQQKTQMGALFGTPHYMSPEQASGGAVDCRTDVYGLGVILYELASGRLPFEGNNLMEILTQHMYRAPVPIRALVQAPDIPSGLEAIILKALSKRPDQRYATMLDFARDLERLGNGETPHALIEMRARSASAFPPSVLPEAMPLPIPARPPRKGRTRWDVYAGMTAILMACGLTLGVFLHAENGKAQVSPVAQAAAPESPATTSAAAASTAPAAPQSADVAPKAEVTDVLFAAEPLDAHVLRGGVDLGSTPLTIEVPKGQRVSLEVRRSGFVSRAVELDGTEKRMTLKLAAFPDLRPRTNQRPKRSKSTSRGGEIVNPWANLK